MCLDTLFVDQNDGSKASWRNNQCGRCHKDEKHNCNQALCTDELYTYHGDTGTYIERVQ